MDPTAVLAHLAATDAAVVRIAERCQDRWHIGHQHLLVELRHHLADLKLAIADLTREAGRPAEPSPHQSPPALTAAPPPPADDCPLTAMQVARRLGTSRATVYKMVGTGELPAFKLGKRMTRFRAADVEAYLSRNRTAA